MSTVDKLRCALEKAGIVFIAENGGGVGVRFRETEATKRSNLSAVQETALRTDSH